MQMVKTVSMAFHPCHKPGRMSVEVYGSRTMVIGPTFRERWQRRVECPEGGLEVAAVLLLTHHQIQHSVGQGERGGAPTPLGRPKLTRSLSQYVCCGSSAR